MLKFIIGLTLLVLFTISQEIPSKIHKDFRKNKTEIVDIGFKMTDRIYKIKGSVGKSVKPISDIFLLTMLLITFIDMMMNKEYKLLNNSMLSVGILYFAKRVMSISTVLPVPIRNKSKKNEFNLGKCNDLFYSGHFIGLTYILMYLYYKHRSLFYPYLLIFIGYFYMNLTCQFHYTIDITSSILFSGMLYYIIVFNK